MAGAKPLHGVSARRQVVEDNKVQTASTPKKISNFLSISPNGHGTSRLELRYFFSPTVCVFRRVRPGIHTESNMMHHIYIAPENLPHDCPVDNPLTVHRIGHCVSYQCTAIASSATALSRNERYLGRCRVASPCGGHCCLTR